VHTCASPQPLQLVFRGELLEYGLSVAYSLAGALLGVPPGQEFRAAIQAAERVLLPAF
jgi:pheromone shutdown protein TraB